MSIIEERLFRIACDERGCDEAWIGGTAAGRFDTLDDALACGWSERTVFYRDEHYCPVHRPNTTGSAR